MTGTFLERNKKIGALAAFLLFLRKRAAPVLLASLLLLAMAYFLGPSSWFAGRGGRGAYGNLLAAFQEARTRPRNGGVGLGSFFGRGAQSSGAVGADSLNFVKGSRSDLERGTGAGARSVAGIVDPAEPKNAEADGVALREGDVGGGSGAALSGDAYATKGFFGGHGRAYPPDGLARGALAALPPLSTPSGVKAGRAHGALSAKASGAMLARAMQGAAAAGAVGGNQSYTQLAEGDARADLGANYCKAPDCPPEYAATNAGAIYDGRRIPADFLASSNSGANSSGLIDSPVDIPPKAAGGAATDARNMRNCMDLAVQCAASGAASVRQGGGDEAQLAIWSEQLPAACADACSCGGCHDLENNIRRLCADGFAGRPVSAGTSCAPLPAYCADLNIALPPSASGGGGESWNYCEIGPNRCACIGPSCCRGVVECAKCAVASVVADLSGRK